MLDLRLRYEGNGVFRPASKLDFEDCCRELGQGDLIRARVTRARSVSQNAYFHALIEAAWDNQRGGPQLPSWRHLKSWLLIQVGHCDVKEFDARAMTSEVAAWLRRTFDTLDFTTDGKTIFVKTAKSVSFHATGSKEMSRIVDQVTAIICTDIVPGVDPASIMDMAKAKVKAA